MANDYLQTAVGRLEGMWREALSTFTPPITRVTQYVDTGLTPPFVWLYPSTISLFPASLDIKTQAYVIVAQLVIGSVTEGYDGNVAARMWTWLPTLTNYFEARRRLVYQADQDDVAFLNPAGVRFAQVTPFGAFNNSAHIGIEFGHFLPFIIQNEPYVP